MLAGIVALSPLISGIMGIINKVVADKDTQAQIEREITMYTLTSDFQNAMAQVDLAKVDQASNSLWQAGWRPFVGWVCGISFCWHYVFVPIILFIGSAFGHQIPLPIFSAETMMTVLFGMLGLGGYRTYEKLQDRKISSSERVQAAVVRESSLYGPGAPTFDQLNPAVTKSRRRKA